MSPASQDAQPESKTLADIEVGEQAVIESIDGDDEVAVRILEMGMTPGAQTKIVGTAPLGDPIEVEVRSYRLSLRRSEAKRVVIR